MTARRTRPSRRRGRFARSVRWLGPLVALAMALAVVSVVVVGGRLHDPDRDPTRRSPHQSSPRSPHQSGHQDRIAASKVPATVSARRDLRVLSDGCRYDVRGVPGCGTLVGASYGANTDPASWEQSLGHVLGVHRTYWSADEVSAGVDQARVDARAGRVAWLSFKVPYSWEEMDAGAGDGWARQVARRLATVPGPVWVAFHHEPEGDGDITAWTRMQARLAPLVRREAPRVAYTIILTGWNQLFGPSEYHLESLWPRDTAIDVVGFDVYNAGDSDFATKWFGTFRDFADSHHTRWAIAETGQSDESVAQDPGWLPRTYRQTEEYGGVALTYYNSRLNSRHNWTLSGAKQQAFTATLGDAPTL